MASAGVLQDVVRVLPLHVLAAAAAVDDQPVRAQERVGVPGRGGRRRVAHGGVVAPIGCPVAVDILGRLRRDPGLGPAGLKQAVVVHRRVLDESDEVRLGRQLEPDVSAAHPEDQIRRINGRLRLCLRQRARLRPVVIRQTDEQDLQRVLRRHEDVRGDLPGGLGLDLQPLCLQAEHGDDGESDHEEHTRKGGPSHLETSVSADRSPETGATPAGRGAGRRLAAPAAPPTRPPGSGGPGGTRPGAPPAPGTPTAGRATCTRAGLLSVRSRS